MTARERVPAPAVEAVEMFPPSANPLLPLVSPDPSDTWLLLDELRELPRNPTSARWLDQLLDDPRLEALPQVREAAVQKLLDFGHPHALLINPEHLALYRRRHPTDLRPGRLIAGAGLGVLAAVAAIAFVFDGRLERFPVVLLFAAGALWALTVLARLVWRSTLRRGRLIGELVLGLGLAAGLAWPHPALGLAVLTGLVPVALAGLAGGWSES